MNAKEMYDNQRDADKAHHEARVIWLTADAPKWACGTPVSNDDRRVLLKQSTCYLTTGEGFNHANTPTPH
ncbi:hypothetical protein HAQ01_05065 [Acidithiobacillus thiooxidans]|uniref:Uncharacterized protein n=1 Tax=Acidithiobacillus sulfurivorans TaxID=1958756 RepID=A0ABS6A233_9PROT|nr:MULTISPECIES: hypothetical protein [Acidithiobacillus]MBU2741854.1 hypothetical protein [Acidithiobacillus albertensis]MBU2760938.1 hypothetical protein [Acidithiobacillus sulfurivorans]MBU2792763.1 hypothetical protein [Acidithiobacillus thiooxidans]